MLVNKKKIIIREKNENLLHMYYFTEWWYYFVVRPAHENSRGKLGVFSEHFFLQNVPVKRDYAASKFADAIYQVELSK